MLEKIATRDVSRERNMGKLTPSLAAETEALREAYAALNRNDIPATSKHLTRRSSGPNRPSFRQAGHITGSQK